MSVATEAKARRLLAEGRVILDPDSFYDFTVLGDTGTYWVTVLPSRERCNCEHGTLRQGRDRLPAEYRAMALPREGDSVCSHVIAARLLRDARGCERAGYLQAIEDRRARDRAEGMRAMEAL